MMAGINHGNQAMNDSVLSNPNSTTDVMGFSKYEKSQC
jgi:hypothetical protein